MATTLNRKTLRANVTTGSAGATVSVTGAGFTPKIAIIRWGGAQTIPATPVSGNSNATTGHVNCGVGFACNDQGTTKFLVVAGQYDDNAASGGQSYGQTRTDCCVLQLSNAGAVVGKASLAFTSDGATLTILTAFTVDLAVDVTFLGGTAVEQCTLVTWNAATATGAQVVSTVSGSQSIRGDCIFALMGHATALNTTGRMDFSQGVVCVDSATDTGQGQWGLCFNGQNAFSLAVSSDYFSTTYPLLLVQDGGNYGSVARRANFTSRTAGSMTWNWVTVTATANLCGALVVQGPKCTAGGRDSAAGRGNFTETCNHQPKVILTVSGTAAAESIDTGSPLLGMGWCDDVTTSGQGYQSAAVFRGTAPSANSYGIYLGDGFGGYSFNGAVGYSRRIITIASNSFTHQETVNTPAGYGWVSLGDGVGTVASLFSRATVCN
jgi:hypothetical protein